MATTTNANSEDAVRPVSVEDDAATAAVTPQPTEQLEIEEPNTSGEEDVIYPTGTKLWLTVASLCVAMFLKGLDLTIVAVAVPSLTDQFKTTADIGWYNAAYGLVLSAFVFFFGKVYTVFSIKSVFMFGIVVFELGSLLCTVATSSKMFIIGRAVAGLGSGAMGAGMVKMLRHLFPLSKQAMWMGLVLGIQTVGLVAAPVLGGALIQGFGWRACFGINLPLGLFCIVFTAYSFHDVEPTAASALSLWEKIRRVNPLGTLLIVPALSCFLIALQWGGVTYAWSDWRIILLFSLFGVLLSVFGYIQYRQGDEATLPLKVLGNRSILAGLWFSACCDGILAVTENYISIYFQGVRGYSAAQSGLLGVPMIAGLFLAIMLAATGTSKIGYYYPFMYGTSVLAPLASGLLTTIDPDQNIGKASALLAFLGLAIGLGIQAPQLGVSATLSMEQVSIGTAVITFGAGMGSSVFVSASSALFNSRLVDEIALHSPSTNGTALESMGLSDIRAYIGPKKLGAVLAGYNEAVVQTLYLPLALGVLTIVGTVAMERRSLKKKQS